RGTEPAGRAGRRGARLMLGVEHDVLPPGGGGGTRAAGRLAADGRGRRRPPGRAAAGPAAPRPRRFHDDPVTHETKVTNPDIWEPGTNRDHDLRAKSFDPNS